jgi:outer membrane lipoprotein-sorting protein
MPLRRVALLFLLVSLLQGCISISRKRVVPEEQRLLPVQTLTRAELIQRLEEKSKSIQTVTATVTLDAAGGAMRTGVLTEYRQTKGFVLVERPTQIRIRAQAPLALATVFDMVANGRQYRVSIPIQNKFIVGDANTPGASKNPVLNLRPQMILDALFVDVASYLSDTQMRSILEETTVGRIGYYVFHFVDISQSDAQLVEKLWIDRSNLEVARKQLFSKDGRLESDVQFADYQLVGDITFPQVVEILRPVDDLALKMTFQKTVLNEKLAAGAFTLERPDGAELVQLNP